MYKSLLVLLTVSVSTSIFAAPITWNNIPAPDSNQFKNVNDLYERSRQQYEQAAQNLSDAFINYAESVDRRNERDNQQVVLRDNNGNRYLCEAGARDITIDPCTPLD